MGRKTLPLSEENEEIQERIRNGICSQPSALADDHQFDHLGDLMKHLLKLGTMTSATSTKKDGGKPSPREVHEEKVRYEIMKMFWTSVHIARQEVITENSVKLCRRSECLFRPSTS